MQLLLGAVLSVALGGLVMGPAYAQSTYGSYGPYDPGGPATPPDSDGDGLHDGADSCPHDPGPPSNSGCPVRGMQGFGNCVQQGYATSSTSDKVICALVAAMAGAITIAIFAGGTPFAVSGALAAWAPLAGIIGAASFGLLCACFVAWMN